MGSRTPGCWRSVNWNTFLLLFVACQPNILGNRRSYSRPDFVCPPIRAFVCKLSLDHRDVHANTMNLQCAVPALRNCGGQSSRTNTTRNDGKTQKARRERRNGPMHPLKAIAIAILAWPAAEIVAFFS